MLLRFPSVFALLIYLFIYFTDVTVLGLVGGAPGGRHRASPIHRRLCGLGVVSLIRDQPPDVTVMTQSSTIQQSCAVPLSGVSLAANSSVTGTSPTLVSYS